MAILDKLWVIHTTSMEEEAGTTDSFSLELRTLTGKVVIWFPYLVPNERERGRTDEYEFDVSDFDLDHEELTPDRISLASRGSGDWLPASIWVIGSTVDGRFHLLAARPDWPRTAWFGTHGEQGAASRSLDESAKVQVRRDNEIGS